MDPEKEKKIRDLQRKLVEELVLEIAKNPDGTTRGLAFPMNTIILIFQFLNRGPAEFNALGYDFFDVSVEVDEMFSRIQQKISKFVCGNVEGMNFIFFTLMMKLVEEVSPKFLMPYMRLEAERIDLFIEIAEQYK